MMFLKVQRNVQAEPVGVYFHQRLQEAGLPVPELIGLDRGEDRDGRGASIWEYIDGVQAHWQDDSFLLDEGECGEQLRRIHDLTFDGPFCFLGDDPPERWFGPASDHWGEMFPCEVASKDYYDQGLLTRDEADILCSLPSRLHPQLEQVEKRLLHMDYFYNGNLILSKEGRRIVGILDYAEAMAGDPLLEIAIIERHIDNPRLPFDVERLLSGYGLRLDRDAPLYRFYTLAILIFERLFYSYANEKKGPAFLDRIKSLLATFE